MPNLRGLTSELWLLEIKFFNILESLRALGDPLATQALPTAINIETIGEQYLMFEHGNTTVFLPAPYQTLGQGLMHGG